MKIKAWEVNWDSVLYEEVSGENVEEDAKLGGFSILATFDMYRDKAGEPDCVFIRSDDFRIAKRVLEQLRQVLASPNTSDEQNIAREVFDAIEQGLGKRPTASECIRIYKAVAEYGDIDEADRVVRKYPLTYWVTLILEAWKDHWYECFGYGSKLRDCEVIVVAEAWRRHTAEEFAATVVGDRVLYLIEKSEAGYAPVTEFFWIDLPKAFDKTETPTPKAWIERKYGQEVEMCGTLEEMPESAY